MEDKIIQKLIESGVTESSAKQYMRYVKNLVAKEVPFKVTMLKDMEAVMKLVGEYAESTQMSILNAICRVLAVSAKSYAPLQNKYYAIRLARIEKKTPVEGKNEKQEENWVSWADVLKKRDEVSGVDKVILSLYTMLPPGRVQEYATMMVNEGENMYDVKKKQFIIRKHKTAGRTGEVVVDVPDELVAVLTEWLNGRTTGLLLGLTAPSITKHMNRMFKKKIGPSVLRHIYVTEKYGETGKEMKKDAVAMRHSVATQQGTYNLGSSAVSTR
jgi:integrase